MFNCDLILELYYKHREERDKILLKDSEYIKTQKKYDEYWPKLLESIPEDDKNILFKIEEINNYLRFLDSAHCYIWGFKDGIRLIMNVINKH